MPRSDLLKVAIIESISYLTIYLLFVLYLLPNPILDRALLGFDAMITTAISRYVTRNPDILSGEPIIVGTRIPVRAIVGLWRLETPPEEIPTQYPQLTLAQVFHTLSFYLDNQVEINEYIERNRIPDNLIHPAVRKALGAK